MLLVVIAFLLPGIALAAPAHAQVAPVPELAAGALSRVDVDALELAITADLDSPWRFVNDGADCRLEQQLGSYGTARFMGVTGQPLRFEVVGHRDLFAEGAIDVVQTSPEWHPDHPQQQLLGQAMHLTGGGIAAGDPIATRVLLGLFGGHDIWMVRHAWFAEDQAVGVKLASIGLRGHYWQFTECFKGPLLRSWAEVERTRIGFSPGAAALDDGAALMLGQLADYLKNDPSVSRVYVDGHTDGQGSAAANGRLARQRAEAVAEFLRGAGVDESLLTVRYHGARYPVADEDTEGGRAQNRRATVRLERNWAKLASG